MWTIFTDLAEAQISKIKIKPLHSVLFSEDSSGDAAMVIYEWKDANLLGANNKPNSDNNPPSIDVRNLYSYLYVLIHIINH